MQRSTSSEQTSSDRGGASLAVSLSAPVLKAPTRVWSTPSGAASRGGGGGGHIPRHVQDPAALLAAEEAALLVREEAEDLRPEGLKALHSTLSERSQHFLKTMEGGFGYQHIAPPRREPGRPVNQRKADGSVLPKDAEEVALLSAAVNASQPLLDPTTSSSFAFFSRRPSSAKMAERAHKPAFATPFDTHMVHAFSRSERFANDDPKPLDHLKGPGDYGGESRGRMGRAAGLSGKWRSELGGGGKGRTEPQVGPGAYNPKLPHALQFPIGGRNVTMPSTWTTDGKYAEIVVTELNPEPCVGQYDAEYPKVTLPLGSGLLKCPGRQGKPFGPRFAPQPGEGGDGSRAVGALGKVGDTPDEVGPGRYMPKTLGVPGERSRRKDGRDGATAFVAGRPTVRVNMEAANIGPGRYAPNPRPPITEPQGGGFVATKFGAGCKHARRGEGGSRRVLEEHRPCGLRALTRPAPG